MEGAPPDPPARPPAAPAGRAVRFATTRWSVVLAAGHRGPSDAPDGAARDALAWLCSAYWYPLYAYARSRGLAPPEAQDLTQGFLAHLLERDALRVADPGRGRFRTFLLSSLRNFLANERDRAAARKRGGGVSVVSIDVEAAEGRFCREPAHADTPERLYERRWALTLLDAVLADLKARHDREGKAALFDRLKPYLAGDADAPTHAQTAAVVGMSEGAVQVAVSRLRKRYRALLREHIGQTVERPEDVDEEIRDLFKAVRG